MRMKLIGTLLAMAGITLSVMPGNAATTVLRVEASDGSEAEGAGIVTGNADTDFTVIGEGGSKAKGSWEISATNGGKVTYSDVVRARNNSRAKSVVVISADGGIYTGNNVVAANDRGNAVAIIRVQVKGSARLRQNYMTIGDGGSAITDVKSKVLAAYGGHATAIEEVINDVHNGSGRYTARSRTEARWYSTANSEIFVVLPAHHSVVKQYLESDVVAEKHSTSNGFIHQIARP